MPDLKISQLTGGGAAQATDEFPNARSGANFKITGANIAAAATSVGTLTSLTVSGVTTLSAGTAAAPALTTSGDTNNGIFFPAADVTAITTAGTERARIDASGNLGVGTASPGQRLEVAGRQRFSGSSVGIVVENRMTAVSVTTSAVTILDDGGSYGRLVIVNGGSGTDRFCDLVLAASGNVSPTVVSSFTSLGSPAARTYTRSGSALQLAMASGTYSVWTLALGY